MSITKEKIDRINVLARKSKSIGLTDEEKQEQQALRDEYRSAFRKNLSSQLDNIYVKDDNGNDVKYKEYAEKHEVITKISKSDDTKQ